MNASKYKLEYSADVSAILSECDNLVESPSDVYDKIAKLDAPAAQKSLSAYLTRTHTLVAREGERIVGVASMDKEGNIGILAAREGELYKKTLKCLLRALERLAEKNELTYVFALHKREAEKLFVSCGYAPFDNGSGDEDSVNEYMLAKEIISRQDVLDPEAVKTFKLDPQKPIKVEGKQTLFPYVLFGVACFFVVLFVAICAMNGTFENGLDGSARIILIVVCIFFVAATGVFIYYIARNVSLKKQLQTMHITNGKVTDAIEEKYETRDKDGDRHTHTRLTVLYVYYDENMTRREGRFTHKYNGNGAYFYKGQEVIVACNADKSYILSKYTLLNANDASRKSSADRDLEDTDIPNITSDLTDAPYIKDGIDPEAYVPLNSAKYYYLLAGIYFAVIVVIIGFFAIFFAIASSKTDIRFVTLLPYLLPFFIVVIAVFGGLGGYYLSFPLRENAKYKRLLESGVRYTSGKFICEDKTYRSDNKNKIVCVYKDDNGKKRTVPVPRLFTEKMVRQGNSAAVVAYVGDSAVVLVKKDKFPNVIKLR